MTSWLSDWEKLMDEYRPGQVRPREFRSFYSLPLFLEHMHMLLEHKQALYAQLSGVDLSTEMGRCAASRLQGQIAMLDFLPELMQLHSKETNDGDAA